MKLSVHIPTFNRPSTINRCLEHLAAQDEPGAFEIIVGLDGPEETTPDPIVPKSLRNHTRLFRCEQLGYIPLRRTMLEATDAEIILWLNDDSYADPGLITTHLTAHKQHSPCVVSGHAHWSPIIQPSLFDRIVQNTDLIFFQNQANPDDTPIRTDFRNCFGLNMSFPAKLAIRTGGVPNLPNTYGYDDIELAYRLAQNGAELWHAPNARVTHDHRFQPRDVHRREYLLGRAAWQYAEANPDFARDLFGRDLRSDEELAYIEQSLDHERRDAERIERSFLTLADTPPDGVCDDALLPVLAEHWIPLKRYLWRWGVFDAANGIGNRWSPLAAIKSPVVRDT